MDLDLDLSLDPATLTAALVDVPSVSGEEERLADAIETALLGIEQLAVVRDGNAMVARTRQPSASWSGNCMIRVGCGTFYW